MRAWGLVALAGAVGATTLYQLNAEKAWRKGSQEMSDVASDMLESGDRALTECYSGNELYLSRKVLCDRECMHKSNEVARASGLTLDAAAIAENVQKCNGPWYCSRSEICEMFVTPYQSRDVAKRRKCAVVQSCANHSQCFPTPDQAEKLSIRFEKGDLDDAAFEQEVEGKTSVGGYVIKYGGFTVRTSCCFNKKRYRLDIDIPCNAAAGLRPPLLLAALAAAGTLHWLLPW
ncbi:hypothetical protein M885DRAFT_522358 [Pelagophyceae sp. CCMP2097]|nr:hypothetical protein M885DRAFT_522358 [Pelagophyceae sp. CCMP2097]|mmetsp:Transcript_4328/g.15265  ORF Transcript_4328/g.15265 Transcript_4328/m.15265 type:complete len:232 (+) Transcript_4328:73-768(+)